MFNRFPNKRFSLTQLETYLDCPYKYYLSYVKRLKWPRVPSGAAFGTAMHRAIEKVNRSFFTHTMDEEDVAIQFTDEWKLELTYRNVEFKKPEEEGELLSKGKKLICLYYKEFEGIEPRAVEEEFRLPIPGRWPTSSQRLLRPRTIKGRIDLVIDGEVVEVKTSRQSYNQKGVDASLQLTLYSWAYRHLYRKEERVLKTVALIKTNTPKIQIVETHREKADHDALMRIITNVIRAIRLRVFYKNTNTRYGCGSCVYRDVC
jgi:CRISPR/Cas system-associated exonuclease Cas4 (RecB family)